MEHMAWEGQHDDFGTLGPPQIKAPGIPLTPVHPFRGEEEVILAGLGPSLDAFLDWRGGVSDLPPVFAINEAVCLVPGCRAGIVFDPAPLFNIGRWLDLAADDVPWLLLERGLVESKQAWVHPDLVLHALTYTRKDCVSSLARPGTGTIALHVLADAGVERVTMVGMDSCFRPGHSGEPCESVRVLWRDLKYAPKYSPSPGRYEPIAKQMRLAASMRNLYVEEWEV